MDRATLAKRRPTTVSSREGYLVALFPQLVMFDKAPVASVFTIFRSSFLWYQASPARWTRCTGIPSQFTFAKKHLSHFDKPDIIYHSYITYIRRRWNIH